MEYNNLIFDLNKLYLGVEEFEQYRNGALYNVQSFEVYNMSGKIECDDKKIYHMINMDTYDEITVNQDGEVIKSNSETRYIKNIIGIKSFKDLVDTLLQDTSFFMNEIEGGEVGVEFFQMCKDHMKKHEKKGDPAFADYATFYNIFSALPNIYNLCFGNPITGQTQEECINEFRRRR